MSNVVSIKGKADQVVEIVTDWLRSGRFIVGEKLPPEKKLAQMLGVSLLTVNKAMSRLEDSGLITRGVGRGTHVKSVPFFDSIAVICDSKHLSGTQNTAFTNALIDSLLESSKKTGIVPQFLIGRGDSGEEFADSLGLNSQMWSGVKGVISRGWREGVEKQLNNRDISVVTISSKDQGVNQIILNYKKLGAMAGLHLKSLGAVKCCVLCNNGVDLAGFNDPLEGFEESFLETGRSYDSFEFDIEQIERDESFCEVVLGILAGGYDSFLFTNENIADNFFRNCNPDQLQMLASAKIITHSSSCSNWDFPPHVKRLVFEVSEICEESFSMIEGLIRGRLIDGNRVYIEPVLR